MENSKNVDEGRSSMKNRPSEKSEMKWDFTVEIFGQCTDLERAVDMFLSVVRGKYGEWTLQYLLKCHVI